MQAGMLMAIWWAMSLNNNYFNENFERGPALAGSQALAVGVSVLLILNELPFIFLIIKVLSNN